MQNLARMDVLAKVLRGEANCGDLRKARGPNADTAVWGTARLMSRHM